MKTSDSDLSPCGLCDIRDIETVLREDREALRSMQKHQPRFTEEQKRELSQVHPWIRTGRLPRAINISVSTRKRGRDVTFLYVHSAAQSDGLKTSVSLWFLSGLYGLQVAPLRASRRPVRRGDPRDRAVQRAEGRRRRGEEEPVRDAYG